MRFDREHRFRASVQDVERVISDPEFYESLGDLPGVGRPEVLSHSINGAIVALSVRFFYDGHVEPVVIRVLRGRPPSWIHDTEVDTNEHRVQFRIRPEVGGNILRCKGRCTFETDGIETVRHLQADLNVRLPLLSRRAERAIGPGIIDRLDREADLLRQRLQDQGLTQKGRK